MASHLCTSEEYRDTYNSEVKPEPLDDDTERYSRSRIKTLNYASYTQLVRMEKIIRCRRPEALA